jgi:hypothetical protein
MNLHDIETIHVKDIQPGNILISVERNHFQYQIVYNISDSLFGGCLKFQTLTFYGKTDYLFYTQNQIFKIFSKDKINYYLKNWEQYCYTSNYLVLPKSNTKS